MPLSDIRVVELGTLPAAQYCTRIFADFGAEVIKVEPPGGDPGRHGAPRVAIGAGKEESGYFGFLNVRKRSVVIDPSRPEQRSRLHTLITQADVLVDSMGDADREAYGIHHDTLRLANPALVIGSVRWFGESGPYRDFVGCDSVCRALAGLVQPIGSEEGPPVPLPDYQSSIIGGLTAFIPLMAALQSPEPGRGRRFELSVHEATLAVADYNVALSWAAGAVDKRWGVNKFVPNFPLGIYRCKRGWIGVTVVTPVQWRTFCKLLGMEELGADPQYAVNRDRLRNARKLEERFAPKFLEKTAEEWFQIGLELRLPFVVVPDMAGLLAEEEFRRRAAFETISHGERTYEAPSSPLRLERTPPRRGGRVPAPGEHEPVWSARTRNALPPRKTTAGCDAFPLDGVRVVDLSMGWAGPLATRHLADLGADVIKIEACQYPDWWRGVDNRPVVFEQMLYEKCAYFMVMNRNKRGITLDLTTPEGVRLVKKLVEGADIVIENYSSGVLPKLGLHYDALREANPDIVMVSMPAFAADGKWRECRAYGSTLEQASGLPSVSGTADGPPSMNAIAYGDPIGGLNATCALLIALYHRRRTGRGQCIDLSQVECMLPMVAPWLVEQSANGRVSPRTGTRHPTFVPHGSFRCAGDDQWVLIALTDDRRWEALCELIGRPDWARDPSLASAQLRRAHEDEIERAIEAWTSVRSADEAMFALQERGIAAGAVRAPFDLLNDPHLCARGVWRWIDHPFIGRHAQPAPAYRDAEHPLPAPRHAPTLGQHNREVLEGLLHLGPDEIDRLADAGIIGTKALPPSQRKARASVGA